MCQFNCGTHGSVITRTLRNTQTELYQFRKKKRKKERKKRKKRKKKKKENRKNKKQKRKKRKTALWPQKW
jgi:hypothetical protein